MIETYNEVYGWMPSSIVNNLSAEDRSKMFLLWINRKSTATGWFVVAAAVNALGENFLEYVFTVILKELSEDGHQPTKEEVIDTIKNVLESFASDLNVMMEFINTYVEETGAEIPTVMVLSPKEKKTVKQQRDAKGRFTKKQ